MASRVFLDTSYIVALVNQNDQYHKQALEIPKTKAFEELIDESRKFARKEGLKKSDVKKAIKKVRSERRH